MPYNNPVSKESPRLDVGLDMVINSLVTDFKAKVGYLKENIFGRAMEFRVPKQGGGFIIEPRVYFGGKEYYQVLYNDNLPCSMFFRTDGDETIVFSRGTNDRMITYTRQLSLVFWGKLDKMQVSERADYPYTEILKRDFMAVLAKNTNVQQIIRYIDEPIDKVFENYTLEENQRLLGMHPYGCLKIDFVVQYKTPAIPC